MEKTPNCRAGKSIDLTLLPLVVPASAVLSSTGERYRPCRRLEWSPGSVETARTLRLTHWTARECQCIANRECPGTAWAYFVVFG